jgi:hypothetical protein
MSDRIYNLIVQGGFSAKKLQDIAAEIAAASEAALNYKVSPKQHHPSLFIQAFIFSPPPWYRMRKDPPASTGLQGVQPLPW